MASSDTLSLFVPDIGQTLTQTVNGAEVVTGNLRDALRTQVFPNQEGRIRDVGIQAPESGDTTTRFLTRSEDTSLIGNADDNSIVFGAVANNAFISTAGGNDSVNVNSFIDGTIDLGEGNDVAVTGAFTDSSISAGAGADQVTIRRTATSVDVDMGTGDDTLIFGGKVLFSSIELGEGADVLRFNRSARNTSIDLGNDFDIDKVYFETRSDIASGTVITGAGEGDELIIGGSEYVFSAADSAFISTTDPGDSITFG
ncbi:hypothetical protein [Cyanobium sp. Lug-B]|uniref:hypothetical protein n=1 Tax=Cyanobium sp. Lug-B TaxID=2823716 RepID=UPI0020CED9EC|nr:hypothetical protein [Cyanobium sp. Lug-B]MCP9798815.1 hypothetical protein [Cyanobium sp. Lug-B]